MNPVFRTLIAAVALAIGTSVAAAPSILPYPVAVLNSTPIKSWLRSYTVESCFANLQAVVPTATAVWSTGLLVDRFNNRFPVVTFTVTTDIGQSVFVYTAYDRLMVQFEDYPKGGPERIVVGRIAQEAIFNSCDLWYDMAKKTKSVVRTPTITEFVPDDTEAAENAAHVEPGLEPW